MQTHQAENEETLEDEDVLKVGLPKPLAAMSQEDVNKLIGAIFDVGGTIVIDMGGGSNLVEEIASYKAAHREVATVTQLGSFSNKQTEQKHQLPIKKIRRPKKNMPVAKPSGTTLQQPLWDAALITGVAAVCVFIVVLTAKLLRDFDLPHYVITFSNFVFGFAAVLVFRAINSYFQAEDE